METYGSAYLEVGWHDYVSSGSFDADQVRERVAELLPHLATKDPVVSLPDSNLSNVQVGDTVYLEQIAGGFKALLRYVPLKVVKVTKTQVTVEDARGSVSRYQISTGIEVGRGSDVWSRYPRILPGTEANTVAAKAANEKANEELTRSRLRNAIIDLLQSSPKFGQIDTAALEAAHAALCGMETVTTATEETN